MRKREKVQALPRALASGRTGSGPCGTRQTAFCGNGEPPRLTLERRLFDFDVERIFQNGVVRHDEDNNNNKKRLHGLYLDLHGGTYTPEKDQPDSLLR